MRNIQLTGVAVAAAAMLSGSAALAAEHTVTMAGGQYTPAKIDARVGDVLVFVNDDGENHNVFSPTTSHAVDIGRQQPGESARLELGQAGTMEIECVFHPHMLLTVTIAP